MWICANDGFISAVEDRYDSSMLVVRARAREHLENMFPGRSDDIITMSGSDYAWRIWVKKEELAKIVADRIMKINYDNFKNSVEDDELHNMYAEFWYSGYQLQLRDLKSRTSQSTT